MSFYRVGQNRKKKPSYPKRPGWDDSVHDLTVYRATPEEVFLRKEAHKSKNHISVKLEKLRKERQRSKLSGAEAQQLAIMKEVLYDQHELQKVLAKSDTMMAVVKDLFGDDPKRFTGFPNVTTAPQTYSEPNKSGSLVASVPDIYTRSEKLSDSVMNQSALNDIQCDSNSETDSEEEVVQPQPISYQSKLNLQRFQDFLHEEEKLSAHMDPPSLISQLNKEEEKRLKDKQEWPERVDSNGAAAASSTSVSGVPEKETEKEQIMQLLASLLNQGKTGAGNANGAQMLGLLFNAMAAKKREETGFKTPPKSQAQHSPCLPNERTPPSAINDTKKVKRTKNCTKNAEPHSESINTSASMNNMRQVLQELENEVAAYELQTGRRPQEETNKTETFSGYTIALVSAVSRLTKYLKETDLRVRTEVTLREQLTQDVYQLRTIIDALATDIILTQEEYGKLYAEHQRYKDNTTAALASMNNQMRELRLMMMGKNSDFDPRHQEKDSNQQSQGEAQQQQQKQQQQQQSQPLNTSNSTTKCDTSMTVTPVFNQENSSTQSGSSSYKTLPAQVLPANSIAAATSAVAASAAVMLSPPVRKTRICTNNTDVQGASNSKVTLRQASLMDISDLSRQDQACSMDPPHLTQTPPVMNTVNVPRPIPLVQSNVNIALPGDQQRIQPSGNQSGQQLSHDAKHKINGLTRSGYQQEREPETTTGNQEAHTEQKLPVVERDIHQTVPGPDLSDLVKLGDETEEQLHRLQELAVEEAMNNPALQELMQTQIAELNRQQEEARQRLLDLLDKQKMQQTRIQKNFQSPQAGDASSSSPLSRTQMPRNRAQSSQISPPISPISQKPEQDLQSLQGRGIVVSLPMVDLDVSGESQGSPRDHLQPLKK